MSNRSPRGTAIMMAVVISATIMALSVLGTLRPMESTARTPLGIFQNLFGRLSESIDSTAAELAELRTLRERNDELENSLALLQAEVAELRELRSDYDRLAELVNYVNQTNASWRYVAADVIGKDSIPALRTIHLNRGTRDGVAVNDPVVTPQGLVGKVTKVSATGCEVLLITDQTSGVNVRLQATRDKGLVEGTLSGDLILRFVDTDVPIRNGDLVLTSGETQTFPPNLIVGQVSSAALSEDKLFQEAPVASFVDFERLEIVLIITNWEPVDLEVFKE